MEKKEWEEMTAATADSHLISGAIIMCGHERTVCWCCGWLALCSMCGLPPQKTIGIIIYA